MSVAFVKFKCDFLILEELVMLVFLPLLNCHYKYLWRVRGFFNRTRRWERDKEGKIGIK
jgi:hypothetical protein